ncbi:iron chelate uptake ABC transporter family permease subunit [Streptomycetaceae bacterium NBC_01309]
MSAVIRTPGGRVSLRVETRPAVVAALLAVILVVVMGITLTTGEFELTVPEVLRALVGQGSTKADFVVNTLRLPRLLTAVLVGAALAVSGAILQSLSGNSLGSPDVIGFTNGSATGALIVIIVLQGSMTETAIGALIGGLVTAIAIYLLAYTGGAPGFRLVVIGIGVSAMLLALNSYLITRARLQDALEAQSWLIGTLGHQNWDQVRAIAFACAVLMPTGLAYARKLSMLEMGDDTAGALGVDARRARFVLLVVSVALAAVATAMTGPIWFIALAAPQLARRLARPAGAGLVTAALMGAVLLTVSDLAVQRIFEPSIVPVGVATGTIGGLYLMWLLVTETRKNRA